MQVALVSSDANILSPLRDLYLHTVIGPIVDDTSANLPRKPDLLSLSYPFSHG
jgi:hypothetical protein